MQVGVEFGDHLARLQALAVGRQAFDPAGHHVHQRQVFFNGRQHVRAQDLDGDFTAVRQHRKVHLRDRSAGHGRALEAGKNTVDGAPEGALDDGHRHRGLKGRHPVLQARQFVGDVGGHEVATGRHDLTELDEDGAQMLERHAQTLAARRTQVAAD